MNEREVSELRRRLRLQLWRLPARKAAQGEGCVLSSQVHSRWGMGHRVRYLAEQNSPGGVAGARTV